MSSHTWFVTPLSNHLDTKRDDPPSRSWQKRTVNLEVYSFRWSPLPHDSRRVLFYAAQHIASQIYCSEECERPSCKHSREAEFNRETIVANSVQVVSSASQCPTITQLHWKRSPIMHPEEANFLYFSCFVPLQ